ncbi:MAG: DctP family TRAP transporter solute-binding subunit [Deltaproteobacteria bacterium]|nr:DctP family TRAP transporter solute-binding subunit [Deltaproteobacteria bacterium]
MFTMVLAGTAGAKEIVIKLAHTTSIKGIKGLTGEYFKKLVDERLKGKVKVQHFHSGQLYSDAVKAIQACEVNAIQMVAPTTSKYTGEFPKLQVFDLPFMFSTGDQMLAALQSPDIGGKLFADFEKKGLKQVGLWGTGFRQFFNAKCPIEKMEDFKGLKFRIQASKAFEEFYKVMAANSIVMPMSEVYQALQMGIIDGEDQHWNSFGSSKHWEVAKYATQCNYTYTGYLVCMNKKFYDGLPADIRTELNKILAEVQEWNWKIVDQKDAEFMAEGRKAGMEIYSLPTDELNRWKKQSQPVIKMYEPIVGKDIMDAIGKL